MSGAQLERTLLTHKLGLLMLTIRVVLGRNTYAVWTLFFAYVFYCLLLLFLKILFLIKQILDTTLWEPTLLHFHEKYDQLDLVLSVDLKVIRGIAEADTYEYQSTLWVYMRITPVGITGAGEWEPKRGSTQVTSQVCVSTQSHLQQFTKAQTVFSYWNGCIYVFL